MPVARLIVLVGLAVLLATSDVVAQALPNLSTIRVRYNARKATVKPEGALKAAIEEIDKAIADASRAGRTGEVRRLYAKGNALLAGRTWTDADEYQTALVIRTDRVIVDSSAPYRVRLEQIFAPAIELTGPLTAHATVRRRVVPVLDQDGEPVTTANGPAPPAPVELGTFDRVSRDLRESPFAVDLDVSAVPDGDYVLSFQVRQQERVLGVATLDVALEKGLDARLRALEAAAIKAAPAVQADIRFPAEYIRKINNGVIGVGTFALTADVAAAEATAKAAAKTKRDPFAGRTGDFERHYVLDGANEIMPYRVFVPKAYTGARAFPLIIALHGLGGSEDGMLDRYAKRLPTLAEERGYIVASPLGYRVDGFYGSAVAATTDTRERRDRELSERDVMQVLKRMRADYKIDNSRIYLMGHSMGAIGTWALAAKYPEIWAALAPFAGVGSPATVSRFRHIPQFVVHGDADATVNVSGSRNMVAEMKKLGVDVTYIEVPGGSHTNVVVPNIPGMFDFFDAKRKVIPTSQ
jgi:predicted peptidase